MDIQLKHDGCGPYTLANRFEPEIFQYRVQMESDAIPGGTIEWCLSNCTGKWSWYFDNNFAWLSFEDSMDHLFFCCKMR